MSERDPETRGWLGGVAGWAAAAVYAKAQAFARRRALAGARVRARRPVISIGNLTVGGTGKTPCVVWLAQRLTAAGVPVVLVARPVGGLVSGGRFQMGDELAVLAELVPTAPIVPAHSKSDGALTADRALDTFGAAPSAGVILVDDAFSHWRLERALDVVLLHAPRPLGNGHLLPLGPLREPPTALARAGVVVLTRADRVDADELACTRAAVSALAPGAVVAAARHAPGPLVEGGGLGAVVDVPVGHPVVALSGLARPGELAHAARALGLSVVEELCYPDHHAFTKREFENAHARAERAGAWLVTSRKDAVRLEPERRGRTRVIDMTFTFMDGEDAVFQRIQEAIA